MRAAEALALGAVAALTLGLPAVGAAQTARDPLALAGALFLLLDDAGHDGEALALVLDGADLALTDDQLRTPLHRAAAVSGDGALIRAMIDRGAPVDPRDAGGRTPLHVAAGENPAAGVAAALVAAGARVSAIDAEGRTPLHLAARAGAAEVGALLVLVGADACATDAAGARALDAALLERIRTAAPEAYGAAAAAFLDCR